MTDFTPVPFHSRTVQARVVRPDGHGNMDEITAPIEFRADPLTGQSIHLVRFPLGKIAHPDLDALEKRSRELPCPFCHPLFDRVTTRFPEDIVPEGRIQVGEAVAFPNINPYDIYSHVVVLSPERHFIRPGEFDTDIIVNALLAAQASLHYVAEKDPDAVYSFIGWNYLPQSGGSLAHPHLQCNAGHFPTTLQKQLTGASAEWYEENSTNFWEDLLSQEKENGERYIGRLGNTEWLTAYAPKGRLFDILVLFPGRASILELEAQDWRDLAEGLLLVFPCLDKLNVPAFNAATYSGPEESFTAHIRLTPRGDQLYSPVHTSDQFYYTVLQDENICIMRPEVAAGQLRERFRAG